MSVKKTYKGRRVNSLQPRARGQNPSAPCPGQAGTAWSVTLSCASPCCSKHPSRRGPPRPRTRQGPERQAVTTMGLLLETEKKESRVGGAQRQSGEAFCSEEAQEEVGRNKIPQERWPCRPLPSLTSRRPRATAEQSPVKCSVPWKQAPSEDWGLGCWGGGGVRGRL